MASKPNGTPEIILEERVCEHMVLRISATKTKKQKKNKGERGHLGEDLVGRGRNLLENH